jgi:predicted metal-dependent phosphotriesterase family hydrolase
VHVVTTSGPVAPDQLGATLMHEHLTALIPDGLFSGGRRDDTVEVAARALACLGDHDIRTVVDLTGRWRTGRPADVTRLAAIAEHTGLRIVAGFGLYKEPFPPWVHDASVDQLTDVLVRQATEGMGDGIVPAGIYGEVGTSLDHISSVEDTVLRAAARAHLETGLAISTHCTLGTMGAEQAAVLVAEGADLSRVVIGHMDLQPDPGLVEAVLRTGANVAFDTWGKEWFDYQPARSPAPSAPALRDQPPGVASIKWSYHRPDSDRVRTLTELVRRGFDGQIVLSCDLSGYEAHLNPSTHGRLGYAYLPQQVLPALQEAGVSAEAIRRMLIDNPARILGAD